MEKVIGGGMSNQKAINQLVKDISGQSNVLAIPRIFIRMTGDIKSALFLSQCVYWSDKSKREDGFFYKSAQEWEEETGLSRHELDTARERTKGFIEIKLTKANGAPTLHYRADIDAITEWIEAFYTNSANGFAENSQMDLPEIDKSDLPESDKSLTETTHRLPTEITTENVVVVEEPPPPNIYSVYEAEIGQLTPFLAEMLDDIDKTYPPGWFELAIKEARRCTTRISLKYIDKILQRWVAEGLPAVYAPKAEPPPPGPVEVDLPNYLGARQ